MRTTRLFLSGALALTIIGCSRDEPAASKVVTAPLVAAPTPAPPPAPKVDVPAAEPLPKSDLPWAVAISEGPVIACRVGDEFKNGDACPEEVFAVRIEWDLTEAPFSLTTGVTKLGPSNEEVCPHYKSLVDQPSDIVQLGRIGKMLSPDDEDVKAWLSPLLKDGLKPVRLRSFDLDGDGRDEQLYELDTHPREHFVKGPAKLVSVVGVRTTSADGTASVAELYRDEGSLEAGEESEYGYGKGTLHGLTDLDGDGALEVVIVGGKIQDMRYELHMLAGGGSAKVAELACKWGDQID